MDVSKNSPADLHGVQNALGRNDNEGSQLTRHTGRYDNLQALLQPDAHESLEGTDRGLAEAGRTGTLAVNAAKHAADMAGEIGTLDTGPAC